MTRVFRDWLPAFLEYADVVESPRLMHFWSGVSAVSACLRRKVWIDMKRFQWSPNFFIIFVAPPGVVAKSTTADISMELVKQVPGIKFGPDVVTWPALVKAFADVTESFEYPVGSGDWLPMSALTLVASELGNLINPQDRDMINLYINLWDGRKSLRKETKSNGNDTVEAPWVNLLGCTTPHWIADNMPHSTVGGGFTSRCVFVYAEKKEKFVAYVDEQTAITDEKHKAALIADLEHISVNLCGPYEITSAARKWGRSWYEGIWTNRPEHLTDEWMEGYLARKQTHMHKLAMILSASRQDRLVIDEQDLILADQALNETEKGFGKVFSRIGRSDTSLAAERFLNHIRRKGAMLYADAYLAIHNQFPDLRDFEGILSGLIRSGQITMMQQGDSLVLKYSGKDDIIPHNRNDIIGAPNGPPNNQ